MYELGTASVTRPRQRGVRGRPMLLVVRKREYWRVPLFSAPPVDEGGTFVQRRELLRTPLSEGLGVHNLEKNDSIRRRVKPAHSGAGVVETCHAVNPCVHVAAIEFWKPQ